MDRRRFAVIAVLIGAAATLLFLRRSCNCPEIALSHPATPRFSESANQLFGSTIARAMDLNGGITVERSLPLTSDNLSMNSVTFAVSNHTGEPITFADQGFGMKFFRFDEAKSQWLLVPLPGYPYRQPVTIPPKTEGWGPDLGNDWTVLADDLQAVPYRDLRLFVSGIGASTNKRYGAFLDVTIGGK